jgi:hypothetical protein
MSAKENRNFVGFEITKNTLIWAIKVKKITDNPHYSNARLNRIRKLKITGTPDIVTVDFATMF